MAAASRAWFQKGLQGGLQTARKHLDVGGLFTFDVWFGPSVLSVRPEQRFKVIKTGDDGAKIIRLANIISFTHLP